MLYREVAPGEFQLWTGGSDQPLEGVVYNATEVERYWSPLELEAASLYKPFDPGVPEGFRSTGFSVQRVDDVVRRVYDLEEVPPPGPADVLPLEPWRFWAIINMPGSPGEEALRAAIDAHPDPVFKAVAKAKLNNPPGGFYNRADPLFSNEALLGALGMSPAVVDVLWANALAIPG